MLKQRGENSLGAVFDYMVGAYETALEGRAIQHEPLLKNPIAYARYVVWDALQIYQRQGKMQWLGSSNRTKIELSGCLDFSKLEDALPRC